MGFMRIGHATHARRAMPRTSSCEPVSQRSRPTHVTVMALGVWPNSSRARGSLWAERRRDGGCVRRGGVVPRPKQRGPVTTDSRHGDAVAPTLLARQFGAARPEPGWGGDSSDVWTAEGWLSGSTLLDW